MIVLIFAILFIIYFFIFVEFTVFNFRGKVNPFGKYVISGRNDKYGNFQFLAESYNICRIEKERRTTYYTFKYPTEELWQQFVINEATELYSYYKDVVVVYHDKVGKIVWINEILV